MSAVAILVAAIAVSGLWWHSTSDQRALRDGVERKHTTCLTRAAAVRTGSAGDHVAQAQRCDVERREMLQRLGL